jgi:hypothetical protein
MHHIAFTRSLDHSGCVRRLKNTCKAGAGFFCGCAGRWSGCLKMRLCSHLLDPVHSQLSLCLRLCGLFAHFCFTAPPPAPSSSTPFCSSATSFPCRLHRTRDASSSPQLPRSLCFQSHLRLCTRGSWIRWLPATRLEACRSKRTSSFGMQVQLKHAITKGHHNTN